MLTSVRSLMAATILAGTFIAAAPAVAQEGPSIELAGNTTLVSEYRFRGVDLSGGDIAIQGGITASTSGFYAGAWGSSLDEDSTGYGHTELDLYAGYSGELASGVTFDISGIYYLYPNAPAGDFDYYEFIAKSGIAVGPGTVTLGVAYSPKQDSLGGGDNLYLFSDVAVGIPETPVTLTGHLGYTDGYLTYTADGDAMDWAVGATVALNDTLSVGAQYVGVDGQGTAAYDFADDAVLFTVSAAF
jgi:uncharacterized protein (TIGR02001 family)